MFKNEGLPSLNIGDNTSPDRPRRGGIEHTKALHNVWKKKYTANSFPFIKKRCLKDEGRQLNEMKIQAQLQGLPTLRNLAKLLMNSMYGRFGLHTEATQTALLPNYLLDKYAQILSLKFFSRREGGDSNLIKEYTKGLP